MTTLQISARTEDVIFFPPCINIFFWTSQEITHRQLQVNQLRRIIWHGSPWILVLIYIL